MKSITKSGSEPSSILMVKCPLMKRLTASALFLGSLFLMSPVSLGEEAEPVFISKRSKLPPSIQSYLVKEIYAVNVIQLENKERIRLLGIDPSRKTEVRRKALEFLHSSVKGKKVRLEYDKRLKDEMGRTLAYVFLDEGKPLSESSAPLQEDLIWRGYAYASAKYPCRRLRQFRKYEKASRKARNGLWEGL